MGIQFNNEKLINQVKGLQEKYGFSTTEEYTSLVKEHPEKAHVIIGEAGLAVLNSMVGKSFEDLTVEDMKELQGAGEDVNPETSVLCFLGSASVGAMISIYKC